MWRLDCSIYSLDRPICNSIVLLIFFFYNFFIFYLLTFSIANKWASDKSVTFQKHRGRLSIGKYDFVVVWCVSRNLTESHIDKTVINVTHLSHNWSRALFLGINHPRERNTTFYFDFFFILFYSFYVLLLLQHCWLSPLAIYYCLEQTLLLHAI